MESSNIMRTFFFWKSWTWTYFVLKLNPFICNYTKYGILVSLIIWNYASYNYLLIISILANEGQIGCLNFIEQ